MDVLNLYIDFDSTMVDSCTAMGYWYNHAYFFHSDFKPAVGKNIKLWNGRDECPLLQNGDIEKIFDSDFFFDVVRPFENAYEVLDRLDKSGKFDLIVCSIGTYTNISKKLLYIRKYFPMLKQSYMICKDYGSNLKMDKSKIVHDGILLDDHKSNLISARFPILFANNGLDKEWNEGYTGKHIVTNWLDFEILVNNLKPAF